MNFNDVLDFINKNTAVITCLVTIIGLFFNNRNLKNTFKNDFNKIHREHFLEELSGLSREVVNVMQEIMDANDNSSKIKKSTENLKNVENKILAHGSAKSIDICCSAQQSVYKNEPATKMLALLSLLICQIRFDLSGEAISYESWFKMKLNDYDDAVIKEELKEFAEKEVKRLKLNRDFLRKLS